MEWLFLIILIPYLYHIIKIWKALSGIKEFRSRKDPGIFISVIIACRNEEKDLPRLLTDISVQEYNQDSYEVVVVDDNSTDKTAATVLSFKGIKNLRVISNSGNGKKQAVRTGVEISAGSFTVTTDADCRVGRKWLKTIASFAEEKHPAMTINPVVINAGSGFFNRFQELEFLSLQGITAGTAALGNPVMCNGANLGIAKEAWLRNAGHLHDELVSGEDVFLLHSLKSEDGPGIMWLESADAEAATRGSLGLISFLRQRGRWISKAGYYSDRYTRQLGIVTFVTILVQILLFLWGFFNPGFFKVFAVFTLLKSVPDFLILNNTTGRYGKRELMRWFVPSQLFYPLYVVSVLPFSFRSRSVWQG
ncbi:MAG: glycosyltransferase [Bacteroidales bacterium]|jgi:cellulose synthase/poly-beta-1,6-N-acetylglucosamine synthase-like glycosyltransferase|nr:glycosyltransferase [Bacteroidales bacterium]